MCSWAETTVLGSPNHLVVWAGLHLQAWQLSNPVQRLATARFRVVLKT